MSNSYIRDCRDCGEEIRMARVDGWNWQPFDLDGSGRHECYTNVSTTQLSTLLSPFLTPKLGWSIQDRKTVGYNTHCWLCNAAVYFHRDSNGGCVLLDALGPPWPIHPCWANIKRFLPDYTPTFPTTALIALGYDGNFYVSSPYLST